MLHRRYRWVYLSNFYFWRLHKLKTDFLQLDFFNSASNILKSHASSLRDFKLDMVEGTVFKAVFSDSCTHILLLLVHAADNLDTVTSLEGEHVLSLTNHLSPSKKYEESNVT